MKGLGPMKGGRFLPIHKRPSISSNALLPPLTKPRLPHPMTPACAMFNHRLGVLSPITVPKVESPRRVLVRTARRANLQFPQGFSFLPRPHLESCRPVPAHDANSQVAAPDCEEGFAPTNFRSSCRPSQTSIYISRRSHSFQFHHLLSWHGLDDVALPRALEVKSGCLMS